MCAWMVGLCTVAWAEDVSGIELESGEARLVVRPQSAKEAHAYLLGVLRDMPFFRANGYEVALPEHPAFSDEVETPGDLALFRQEIYRIEPFQPALRRLNEGRDKLDATLAWFAGLPELDGFRRYPLYEVTLTLYGSGGSYRPDTGRIILFTRPDGSFKGGGGVHTIAHEMMHLAVEEGIVQRFALSHWEKERLIDLLVKGHLGHLFPDYRLQQNGVDALDRYLDGVPLTGVAAAIAGYRADHPVEQSRDAG
ncbi:hypothetical protein ABI59_14560 [Acidobacteria bacterium Mor1]|nr:hypothetical protein ABI59_14560 [Acidobacteria bacterium Mor1]